MGVNILLACALFAALPTVDAFAHLTRLPAARSLAAARQPALFARTAPARFTDVKLTMAPSPVQLSGKFLNTRLISQLLISQAVVLGVATTLSFGGTLRVWCAKTSYCGLTRAPAVWPGTR